MKNARLFIGIISTIVWEAAIVAIIKWGLPRAGVRIPLWGTVLICLGFAAYSITFYRIGSGSLRRKSLPGSTNMIGVEGRVSSRLDPEGFVRIEGELWKARSENGKIDRGTDIVVVNQIGLKLVVRKK